RPIEKTELPSIRALRGEPVMHKRYLLTDNKGCDHIVMAIAIPFNQDSHTIGAIVSWRDITETEHLLSEEKRYAAELDAIISSMADGLVIFGPDGNIRRINHAAINILGYTDGSIDEIAQQMASLWVESPEGNRYAPEELPVGRALHGERVLNQVMVLHPSDTRAIWVATSAGPLRSPQGELLGAVLTFTDITMLHQLQQRMQDFVHTVSHDLRVPLTTIHGYMQLIEQQLSEQGVNGLLTTSSEAIRRSVWRMNAMIQDLVDSARQEGLQLTLKRASINLQPFMLEMLKRTKTVLNIDRIYLDVPKDLPPVLADTDRLERILANLLSNALKYSPEDSPVSVKADQLDDEIVVSITDQGRGIAPEDMRHLFEQVYRGKGERKAEGIGLGLYITRILVEAHGGRIWVDSTLGQGSTFHFTLPIALEQRNEEQRAA
ncbi:MAG TPA: ATP-binding protein, partial [Armatimonadota bacterium]|nr:ATP-binding protein [Armatimonadota bacterium]